MIDAVRVQYTRCTELSVQLYSCSLYRVGLFTALAKTKERATLAHFVVVRPVTGHSCSAGDGAPYDVLGFVRSLSIGDRVRPQ